MDSGLGVAQWPLSPYATAFAAGALFCFCVVFWKHRSNIKHDSDKKDLYGRKSFKVDPDEKKDERSKSVSDGNEKEKKATTFPVLTFRELNPRFNSEYSTLRSPFRQLGAIPRRVQRSRTLEDSQLFTALRRRSIENRSWQKLSRAPSNFSYVYHHSLSFANETPSLNARFEVNASPSFHHCLRQFKKLRNIQLPEFSSREDFKNFDVLINPEILKDKPITRSALSLTLERQLHRFLNNETTREADYVETSSQVDNIAEEDDSESVNKAQITYHPENVNADTPVELCLNQESEASTKKTEASLWDSGYCEKSLDERYSISEVECSELPATCESAQSSDAKIVSQDSTESKSSGESSSTTTSGDTEATVRFNQGIISDNECDENDYLNDNDQGNNDYKIDDPKNDDENELLMRTAELTLEDNVVSNTCDEIIVISQNEPLEETKKSEFHDKETNNTCDDIIVLKQNESLNETTKSVLNDNETNNIFHEVDDINATNQNELLNESTKPVLNDNENNNTCDKKIVTSEIEHLGGTTSLAFDANEANNACNDTFVINPYSQESIQITELPCESKSSTEIFNDIRVINLNSEKNKISESILESELSKNEISSKNFDCRKRLRIESELDLENYEFNKISKESNGTDSTAEKKFNELSKLDLENDKIDEDNKKKEFNLISEAVSDKHMNNEGGNDKKHVNKEGTNEVVLNASKNLEVVLGKNESIQIYDAAKSINSSIILKANEETSLEIIESDAIFEENPIFEENFNATSVKYIKSYNKTCEKTSEDLNSHITTRRDTGTFTESKEINVFSPEKNELILNLEGNVEEDSNFTLKDKESRVAICATAPEKYLGSDNQLHYIKSSEIKRGNELIKIKNDDENHESENEIDDILNLYANILEDFNGGSIKAFHKTKDNIICKNDEKPQRKQDNISFHSFNDLNPNVKIKIHTIKSNSCSNLSSPTKRGSTLCGFDINIKISEKNQTESKLPSKHQHSNLERFQEAYPFPQSAHKSECEQSFSDSKNFSARKNALESSTTRVSGMDDENTVQERSIKCSEKNSENTELERIQKMSECSTEKNIIAQSSAVLESENRSEKQSSRLSENALSDVDVIVDKESRDPLERDVERAVYSLRQMDRETGERSVAVESTVTTETTLRRNGDTHLSTALVSHLTLDDWSKGSFENESISVRTTITDEIYSKTFDELVPVKSSEKISKKNGAPRSGSVETESEINGKHEISKDELLSSPRADRLKGLLSRDEERRARSKFHHLADSGHVGGTMEGEWDRLLRDVLASVSELERWERRQCDVSADAEDAEHQHHSSQSDSSFTMEEESLSPTKGETPTKVKNLRFKLDPDVFDVPSDDSFYDDDENDCRKNWRKQSKYRAFSSLELKDEPVRLVSVHASVVPAGQKMVARPVGIDLRVRLTEERQSKRAHVSTSPSQAKRRSPVSDKGVGWCHELSPVTENVDWRENFTPVVPEHKPMPNGILKTPSPKTEPAPVESPNPFKLENGVTTNGVSPVIETKSVDKSKYNGLPWKPNERKPLSLPRKKFEPDPEAIERITGYKTALSKPPLPPPVFSKAHANLILKTKVEQARKQYLDNKAALAASKVDGTQKFQQFLNQAQNDRARIVTSVPDLAAIERAVTEQWMKEKASASQRESPSRETLQNSEDVTPSRGSTPDDAWANYVQSCRQHLGRRSQSMTYLETDIDIIPVLDEDNKCHSISAFDETDEALPDPDDSDLDQSREDLDDSGRAKSEHELRIEKSLRSLPVPEWYRRSEKTKSGFLLGSSNKEKRGWAAAKSLASSTSSLASCGLRRPVRSLRSSRENIPWSKSSSTPDGPTLSLALAKAFREPYLGWRARTPTSSGVSSSPRASPPSWGATTTDDEVNGVSFDGEDAFGRTISSEDDKRDEPLSLDDTGADAVTVSMDTNEPVKLPGGEDTCDDINNMSMETCELFDASVNVVADEDPSAQADTGDDIDNLSTDTTTNEKRKLDSKLKRYSYSQSIYNSEWDEEEESRGDHKSKSKDRDPSPSSNDHKIVWIESSFVGSRTTTSILVLPQKTSPENIPTQERPASR